MARGKPVAASDILREPQAQARGGAPAAPDTRPPADLGVLVLAAGKGTRIAPVAGDLPKPLLEVGGRSLLAWHLGWVGAWGVREVWINLHHQGEAIRRALGAAVDGVAVHYAPEEHLLGTAGAWRRLAAHWPTTSLVIYGDNFMHFDLGRMWAAHRAAGRVATVALFDPARHTCTPGRGGQVRVEGDRIVAFEEGGEPVPGALVNAGAYFLEGVLAADLPDGTSDFGHDVLPGLAASGRLTGYVIEEEGFCLGLDTPARFAAARALVAAGRVPR